MRSSRGDWKKQTALALLAVGIASGTTMLVFAARHVSLDWVLKREPFTVSAALQLFSVVFVVVGAGWALVRLLIALRRSGREVPPDDSTSDDSKSTY
jgi:hypothetical protein